MTGDISLPGEDKERKIFVRALRDYRNACEPPDLTPSCPYFTWTEYGPACGEECADILAKYGKEEEQRSIDLGAGIVILGPRPLRRPRRGPTSSDRPFDPKQIYLADEDRRHAERRTTALMVELQHLVTTPPGIWEDPSERTYDIRAASEQLESRGLDPESVIRHGIGIKIPMSVGGYLLVSLVGEISEELKSPDPAPEWREFLLGAYRVDVCSGDPEPNDLIKYVLSAPFFGRIRAWVSHAPIDHISQWIPPAIDEISVASTVPTDEIDQAVWLADRFTETYYREWQESSLRLEWLYIHGRLSAPCSRAAMAERRVDVKELAMEIAEQVSGLNRKPINDNRPAVGDFVLTAAEHLRNGRLEAAVAIFEALARVAPEDAEAHNNYGFCLLPVDPAAALMALDRANMLYRGTSLVTVANRVLAFHLMGYNSEALAVADSEIARDLPSLRSWMWDLGDTHKLILTDLVDTRHYLGTLVEHIRACNVTIVADEPSA